MANEITKIIDQNSVDHPLRDAAAQTALTGILNGQNIDSFGDVESALEGKFPRSEQAVLGAKNLIPLTYENSTDIDVTLTTNSDNTITVNGTQGNVDGQFWLSNRYTMKYQLPAGSYRFSGGSSKCFFSFDKNNVTGQPSQGSFHIGQDNGSGLTFTLDVLSDVQIILIIKKYNTFDNVTIYPLLTLVTDTDRTYAPPTKTNRELTEDVAKLSGYLEQSVTLSTSGTTAVTFTDASITANSQIQYGCSTWGIIPDDITCSSGSCVVTMPKVVSAATVTVRIYVR